LDAGAGFLSYLWSDGFTERIHTIFNEGIHWVEVKTNCGQLLRDSINIQFSEETLINLPDTLYFCENEIKSIGVSGFETYQWLPSEIVSCNDCSETIISTTVDTVIYLTASYETGCYSSDSIKIIIKEIITSLDTLQLCQGDTLHIFGQDVTQEGTYNQTFTASNGCDSTQYFVVEYYEESQVQEFDFSMCQGDSLSFLNVWITDFGDFSIIDSSGNCLLEYLLHIDENPSYEIFFQESICKGEVLVWQGMEINDEGQYFANLSTSSGCDSILSLTLKHFPEVSYQVNINASCADSDTGNVTVSPEGNNLAWAELNGVPSDNFSFQNLNAGTYVLSVIDINGCRSDSMIIVDNYQFNEVDLEVLDNICADDSVGSIASQNHEYLISTNLDSIFSNEIMNLSSGNYTIYIKTSKVAYLTHR